MTGDAPPGTYSTVKALLPKEGCRRVKHYVEHDRFFGQSRRLCSYQGVHDRKYFVRSITLEDCLAKWVI